MFRRSYRREFFFIPNGNEKIERREAHRRDAHKSDCSWKPLCDFHCAFAFFARNAKFRRIRTQYPVNCNRSHRWANFIFYAVGWSAHQLGIHQLDSRAPNFRCFLFYFCCLLSSFIFYVIQIPHRRRRAARANKWRSECGIVCACVSHSDTNTLPYTPHICE